MNSETKDNNKMATNTLAEQQQQALHASHEEAKQNRQEHPMQGQTIDTRAPKMDQESSTSGRSSSLLSSSSDDEQDGDDEDSSDNDFQDFGFETSIRAWDQITELTHEITSSLMAKQASVLCARFRRESTSLQAGPPVKKRRVPSSSVLPIIRGIEPGSQNPAVSVVTTSDEEASRTKQANENSAGLAAVGSNQGNSNEGGLPSNLYEHVDRIGRMSKLVMEIEYCQQELRKEMLSMKEEEEKVV